MSSLFLLASESDKAWTLAPTSFQIINFLTNALRYKENLHSLKKHVAIPNLFLFWVLRINVWRPEPWPLQGSLFVTKDPKRSHHPSGITTKPLPFPLEIRKPETGRRKSFPSYPSSSFVGALQISRLILNIFGP